MQKQHKSCLCVNVRRSCNCLLGDRSWSLNADTATFSRNTSKPQKCIYVLVPPWNIHVFGWWTLWKGCMNSDVIPWCLIPSNITPGKQILVEFLQARFRVKIIKSDCHCYQRMWILSASRYEERGKRVSSIPIIYTAQDNRKWTLFIKQNCKSLDIWLFTAINRLWNIH